MFHRIAAEKNRFARHKDRERLEVAIGHGLGKGMLAGDDLIAGRGFTLARRSRTMRVAEARAAGKRRHGKGEQWAAVAVRHGCIPGWFLVSLWSVVCSDLSTALFLARSTGRIHGHIQRQNHYR